MHLVRLGREELEHVEQAAWVALRDLVDELHRRACLSKQCVFEKTRAGKEVVGGCKGIGAASDGAMECRIVHAVRLCPAPRACTNPPKIPIESAQSAR